MDIKFADKNLLDCLVHFGENTFFLSCIYGEPVTDGRSAIWERLSRIGAQRTEPWCMIGDFNEVLSNEEKTEGPRRSKASFLPFADMLKSCGMVELVSKGNKLTYGRSGFIVHWTESLGTRNGISYFRPPIKLS